MVAYPWHALFGKEVRVHGRRNWGTHEALACMLEDGPDRKAQEIPDWMFDAAVCAAFEVSDAPWVPFDVLSEVCRLLEVSGVRSGPVALQDPPCCEVQPGGADEDYRPGETAGSAGAVRPTPNSTDMAEATEGGEARGDPIARMHARGPKPEEGSEGERGR